MKKMIVSTLALALVAFVAMTCSNQQAPVRLSRGCPELAVEAPSLSIGDQWTYKQQGVITSNWEVIAEDGSSYLIKVKPLTQIDGIREVRDYPADEIQGYDKKTMNLVFKVDETGKRTKYDGARRKVLNFPIFVGKKWSAMATNVLGRDVYYGLEDYFVSSYEEIETAAGRFKTFKIEYSRKWTGNS